MASTTANPLWDIWRRRTYSRPTPFYDLEAQYTDPESFQDAPYSSTQSGPHGKWKKVIEQLGKMTGPEPDWGLAGQRVGPASPWSPTNIPYAETAGLMGFRKKKEGPY